MKCKLKKIRGNIETTRRQTWKVIFKKCLGLTLPVLFAQWSFASTNLKEVIKYVAPNGKDEGPGTKKQPFKSISKCTTLLAGKGGGTCLIRKGTYRETVPVGTNLKIMPFSTKKGPEGVTISAFDPLPNSLDQWHPIDNGKWYMDIDLTTNSQRLSVTDPQVLLDGQPTLESRWPNISQFKNQWDRSAQGYAIAAEGTSMFNQNIDGKLQSVGDLRDPHIPGNISLVGSVIHVFGGRNWGAHTGVIYQNGPGYVRYIADNINQEPLMDPLKLVPGNRYYIMGGESLLDQDREVFYETNNKRLFVRLPEGDTPANHSFEAKMREFAFNLDGSNNSTVRGVRVFGSISMNEQSHSHLLDGLDISYVSHFNRNVLGPFAGFQGQNTGLRLWGENHTLKNSKIIYSSGNGISILGNKMSIVNNSISYIDSSGSYNAPIFLAPRQVIFNINILHNTIAYTGRDAINYGYGSVTPGTDEWSPGALLESRIAFNDISNYGLLNEDLGGIYICCNVEGSRWTADGKVASMSSIDHNRVHDSPVGSGIYFDNESHGFAVHHNFLYNNFNAGLQLNGYKPSGAPGHNYGMTINNNTFFKGNGNSIQVQAQDPGGLSNTYISNNIFVTPSQARTGCQGGICYGKNDFGSGGSNNYYGDPGFENSTVPPFDFRLWNGDQNSCSYRAQPMWTDTFHTNTLCTSGMDCSNPVTPSMGGINTKGFIPTIGVTANPL